MQKKFDLVVIGGGPGGYVAAIKGAQYGLSVCLIEKSVPGGICLNWGCIPTKSLISDASRIAGLSELASIGVTADISGLDYSKIHSRSRAAAASLAAGVKGLLKKNKVTVIKGTGSVQAGKLVKIVGEVTAEIVEGENIIIATGSSPASLSSIPFDGVNILSSDDLLATTALPKTLAIIGGGAIGCEFAYVMSKFGVKVTLLEAGSQLLPNLDSDVADGLCRSFRQQGIDVRLDSKVGGATFEHGVVNLTVNTSDVMKVEKVLVAVGRSPNTASVGLDRVGLSVTRAGHIPTGDWYETSIKGIYAIGDVTEGPALAHVASASASVVIDRIVDRIGAKRLDPELIPSAVYCEPQVAAFGLTEAQCAKANKSVAKSTFPFAAVGKAVTSRHVDGFVKILADKNSGEILGCSLLGDGATELVHELLLAKSGELLVDDIVSMIHAHPTLSEGVLGAAEGVFGKAVHI